MFNLSSKSYRTTKSINLGNGWGIDCITSYNAFTGIKRYSVEVCMELVPWRETVESYSGLSIPEEANQKYIEMKKKYLAIGVRYLV